MSKLRQWKLVIWLGLHSFSFYSSDENSEILCAHPAIFFFLFCYQMVIVNHLFKNKYITTHVTYFSFPLVLRFINKLKQPCFGFLLTRGIRKLNQNLQ